MTSENSVQISQAKYIELGDNCSVYNIVCHQKVDKVVKVGHRLYVCTASGSEKDADVRIKYSELKGYEVVPLAAYRGKLKPLFYDEHYRSVDRGERFKSYQGMQVKYRSKLYVFVGSKIIFEVAEIVEQAALF